MTSRADLTQLRAAFSAATSVAYTASRDAQAAQADAAAAWGGPTWRAAAVRAEAALAWLWVAEERRDLARRALAEAEATKGAA